MKPALALFVTCTSFLFAVAAEGATRGEQRPTPREIALKAAEAPDPAFLEGIASRLAQAVSVRMVAPLWEVGRGRSTDLWVINAFGEPIDATVQLLDAEGGVVSSALLTVEPARHLILSLGSLVGSSVGRLEQGSLRLDFMGDPDMLQAWVVRSGPNGVSELALKKVSADTERRLTSFWDLRRFPWPGDQEVGFWMVNGGSDALSYRIETGSPAWSARVLDTGLLQPGEQRRWEPRGGAISSTHGVVSFVHEGAPGSLAVAGFVEGRNVLAALPVVTPEASLVSPEYHAVRLPFVTAIRSGLGEAVVILANTADRAQSVTVQVVASADDSFLLAANEVEIRPGEVRTVELKALAPPQEVPESDGARVVVRGELPGLLVTGVARNDLRGETAELAFFPKDKAHPNGSYPLPDPGRFAVSTTLVNLGPVDSRIVGQVSWHGGTYSIGPIVIPAGASYTVDFRSLATRGTLDLAERTLPPSFENGFFHWTVQGGSTQLIARTEVRPDGAGDAFGFNCFGCCSERSRGAVIPSSTTFPYYATGGLEGVEFVDTCSGTMGPYSLYQPSYQYAWPLSWNGTTVSASAPDSQSLLFTATGHKITIMLPCSETAITIYGAGPATALKVTVLDISLPANRISVRLEPAGMSGSLKVYLAGTAQKVLVNTTYSSGDHSIGFGNLGSYTAGQVYDHVVAEWTVNGKTASGSQHYKFKALGSYNHTQYNTPASGQCSGSPVGFCYFTGDCINVQSCTVYHTAQAPSGWVNEVEENGAGYHSQLGFMGREGFCLYPGACGHTLRQESSPCPSCSGMSVVAGMTVAANKMNQDLPCGSRVFVDGVGVVQVTDHGGGLAVKQLDHYVGISGCNQASTIGYRATFLLL